MTQTTPSSISGQTTAPEQVGAHSKARMIEQLLANPALVLFVSANIVNAGNLLFNILLGRWMGPQLFGDLAVLITVKLSILSVLNAVQFEVASRVARLSAPGQQLAAGHYINHLNWKLIKIGTIAFLLLAVLWFFLQTDTQNLSTAYLIFAISLPFMTPLTLVRGWSQGALDLRRMIWSAQAEITVRLVGAAVAWHLGAGLLGIAFAIALSIVIGWYFAIPGLPQKAAGQTLQPIDTKAAFNPALTHQFYLRGLLLASLPWAALQLGQVLALDGDFLIAKFFLDAEQGGLTAVTALVQRTLFFGCFGIAMAVLPAAAAVKSQRDINRILLPVIALLLCAVGPSLAVLFVFPEILINLVFGPQFLKAAQSLGYAGISGGAFLAIYLMATFFLAQGKVRAGYLVLLSSLMIVGLLSAIGFVWPQVDMHLLVKTKALLLGGTALLMFGLARYEYRQYNQY